MQPVTGIKPSFSGGEFAPSLYSRVDLAKYAIGARKLRNFIIHPHGGISNRPGFKYIATGKTANKAIRVIPFEFSTTQAYVIEFGEYYCRFYKNGAPILYTATDAANFNPVTSYTTDAVNFVKVGPYISLNCGTTKRLHVSAPYGESVTGKTVAVAIAAGDTLAVTYVAGLITISLANATAAKNKASLIQAALRAANASIDDWYVTENAAYAAARPTAGVTLGATALTANAKLYTCILASAGAAENTNHFPPAETTYWTNQAMYEIATPYAEDELRELNYTQSADVLYVTHPDHAPMQIERHADLNWEANAYDYQGGPFMLGNVDESNLLKISAVTGTGKTLTATGFTFDAYHVGSIWKLIHYIEGQALTVGITGTGATGSITCGGTWRLITHGTWTMTIRIEKSTDGGSTWTMLREFSSADDFNANTYGTEDMSDNADPFLVRLNCTADTSGTCNANLTSDPYYQNGIVKITAVAAGGATATADVLRNCGATTDTIDWAEGSWSDYRGWPAVVEFHPEDRLVFANTYDEPQTYWMTQTGDYTDFSRSSPLVDSDAISSPLPSRKVNGINGLVPLGELVALTLSNECSIRSSSGPISPTSVYNKVHGWEGSYGIRPLLVGNRAIYIQSTGSIMRDLGFVLTSDTFEGADLTIFSNHLFTGHTIVDMAYQQNPDKIVWAIRNDGLLLSMTYMREQEIIAWSWHDTYRSDALPWVTGTAYVAGNWVEYEDATYLCKIGHTADASFAVDLAAGNWVATALEASFESLCTIRGSGYDELWVSVNRGGNRYIERMAQRMVSAEPEDQFFVDCGITYDGAPTATIIGLDHLEGCTVSVLADGNVLARKIVVSGAISLGADYSVVQVGLPYIADMETLNVEVNLPDGTAQGRKVKISSVIIRFLNSRGGWLGPNENDLFEIAATTRSTYDDPLELFSGDHAESLSGGYADGGRMFYRQLDPLPVTIAALIPTVTIGGTSKVL